MKLKSESYGEKEIKHRWEAQNICKGAFSTTLSTPLCIAKKPQELSQYYHGKFGSNATKIEFIKENFNGSTNWKELKNNGKIRSKSRGIW